MLPLNKHPNIFALLDDARANKARYYTGFVRRDTVIASEVETIDHLLNQGFAQGLHCTLRIPYDFGVELMGLNHSTPNRFPLCLDWYTHCEIWHQDQIHSFLADHEYPPSTLLHAQFAHNHAHFVDQIYKIHEHIQAGDVYQINYTDILHAQLGGDPITLYTELRKRQPAPFSALMYHPEDGYTLCLSPECFLRLEPTQITTEPMKGTAPAPDTPEKLTDAITALANDPKNRAENTMIVDLLRNDLTQISEPFGVKCDQLFHVAQHGKVLQMTSRICAKRPKNLYFSEILKATFPCGSITGAPKRMAMQLIHTLENRNRGLYTGSIGYLEPDLTGVFNVVIRTLEIQDNHQVRMGIGAGITICSQADEEYAECQLKAKFATQQRIGLIETMALNPDGEAPYFQAHWHRLQASAKALGIPFPNHITRSAPLPEHNCLRLHLSPDGELTYTYQHIPKLNTQTVKVGIAPTRFKNHDPLRRHKIDQRQHLDHLIAQANEKGLFDLLCFNDKGYLLEGARSNVFIKLNDQWFTPSLSLDILPGIMRQQILQQPQAFTHYLGEVAISSIQEARLELKDCIKAQKILICNSLRGILQAELVDI